MKSSQNYGKKLKRKLFWRKYGRFLWLLPLIIILVCLICLLAFGFFKRRDGKNPGEPNQAVFPEGTDFSISYCISHPDAIPDYAGEAYIVLCNGMPSFNQYDLLHREGEQYDNLDELGRCGVAVAMLCHDMMPTAERGSIGNVKPSGWVQKKYPGIVNSEPPYLYNRCHLIAYALTGQNANEKNLITGTRFMNAETMLRWEKKVMKYLDDSDGHVLYRVTPYFKEDELVARGVEMEAYSVEDQGDGICFHVFVYNVQPGVLIDYLSGDSMLDN